MGVARDLFAATSGIVAKSLSWFGFFSLTAAMSLPGIFILLYLMKKKAVK
jgi:hypothetical protein